MRSITVFSLAVLSALMFSADNFMDGGIPMLEIPTAEAGPLSKRLESKHRPPPHSQASMQGGDSGARQECIEILHNGDHEGARECIRQLRN